MKGRFKDRAKQITLIVLFLIISVLTISLIAGRINTKEILIVKKDGLNTNLALDKQIEFFEKKEILNSEMKYFKGAVVTDVRQLEGKVLLYELKAGSPVPKAALMEPKGAGEFAALMKKGRTVHLLSQAKIGLPPVQEGDIINIALAYKQKSEENGVPETINTGLLMSNIKIYKVIENNIYVDVDLEQDLVLSTASQLGTFVYQIPGQKSELCGEDTTNCSTEEVAPPVIKQSDIFDAILNKTYITKNDTDKLGKDKMSDLAEDISKNIVNPDEKDNTKSKEKDTKESNSSSENSGGEVDER